MLRIAAVLLTLVALTGAGCTRSTSPQPPSPTVLSARDFLSAGTDYPDGSFVETYLTTDPVEDGDAVRFSVGDDGVAKFDVRLIGTRPQGLTTGARVRFAAGSQWPGGALSVDTIELVAGAVAPWLTDELASRDVSVTVETRMAPLARGVLGDGAAAYRVDGDKLARLYVVEATSAAAAQRIAREAVNHKDTILGFSNWLAYQHDATVIVYALDGDKRDITAELQDAFGQPVAQTPED